MNEPVRVYNLPHDKYPFTVRFLDHETDEVLDTIEVAGPGLAEVPGFAPRKVDVAVTWPDGHTERESRA